MVEPIWKDKYITIGTGVSYSDFSVRIGSVTGAVIYSGRAFARPGESSIDIRLNDIAADYLRTPGVERPVAFYVTYTTATGTGGTLGPFTFLNDWSYNADYDAATDGMSFPITGRIVSGQWIPYTALATSATVALKATVTKKDGSTTTVYIPVSVASSFGADPESDFVKDLNDAGTGTALFAMSWTDAVAVTIQGSTYRLVDSCARWAVYYINAFGGWDTLLLEGNVSEKDNITRHTRAVEYDNADAMNRGRRDFVNEITKLYTLRTGWLSDEQSERMHHLLNSVNVYLYDIAGDKMLPVVLTDTETPYKTYNSDGMVSYEFTAEVAHEMPRR